MKYNIDAQAKCLGLVSGLIESRGYNLEPANDAVATKPVSPGPDFTVFIVMFSYILGNYKALISSTLPDGRYYEVTYNAKMGEHYIDTYIKTENVAVVDGQLLAPLN